MEQSLNDDTPVADEPQVNDEPLDGETPSSEDNAGNEPKTGDEHGDNGQAEPQQPSNAQTYLAEVLRERAELQRKLEQYEQTAKQVTAQPPNIEEFDDWGAYQDALRSYERESLKAELLAELQQSQSQQSELAYQAEVVTALDELKAEGVDMQAYFAKAESLPPLPVTLDKFGLSAKETFQLAKELIDDPVLYQELAKMSPYQFSARLGVLIENRKAKAPPKQSKAPPPITPVSANSPAKRDIHELSDEEFLKARGLS